MVKNAAITCETWTTLPNPCPELVHASHTRPALRRRCPRLELSRVIRSITACPSSTSSWHLPALRQPLPHLHLAHAGPEHRHCSLNSSTGRCPCPDLTLPNLYLLPMHMTDLGENAEAKESEGVTNQTGICGEGRELGGKEVPRA